MTDELLEIIITANSPGEVAAWVKPAVRELKKSYPRSKISVFLPPCIFASGSEKKVLKKFVEINMVYEKREYLKYILLQQTPPGFNPGPRGIVIFLGGDLLHAVLLGKRLKYPVIAYTEGVYSRGKQIERFLVPDRRTEAKLLGRGADPQKVEVIGNLMLDAITPGLDENKLPGLTGSSGSGFNITLFPGSRPAEVDYMLPFFLEIITGLSPEKPALNKTAAAEPAADWADSRFRFLLSQSPFVSDKQLAAAAEKGKGEFLLESGEKKISIGDLKIDVFSNQQYSLMQATDLALTIPGTNNLELAFLGTPMVVFLPLNRPEKIPLPGLAGLLGRIPLLGPALMRYLVPKTAARMKYVALINAIAGREIVPEIRGILKPAALSAGILKIIEDREGLRKMSANLKEAAGSRGAVRNLVRIAAEVLEGLPSSP